jgi:hypothetical protein
MIMNPLFFVMLSICGIIGFLVGGIHSALIGILIWLVFTAIAHLAIL